MQENRICRDWPSSFTEIPLGDLSASTRNEASAKITYYFGNELNRTPLRMALGLPLVNGGFICDMLSGKSPAFYSIRESII